MQHMKLKKVMELINEGDSGEYLSRTITRIATGFILRGSSRVTQALLKERGLLQAKGVDTPAVQHPAHEEDALRDKVLQDHAAHEYRSRVGKIMFMATDRRDLQFASKEAARDMANPTLLSEAKVKRIVRYVRNMPMVSMNFEVMEKPTTITITTDSDWAGDVESRKSTSGGIVFYGSAAILTWSRTQPVVALSSGEAELYAMTTGATEGRFVAQLLKECGRGTFKIKIETDSAAAKGSLERIGVQRMRHLDIKKSFLKQLVKDKEVEICRITTQSNAADILTKALSPKRFKQLLDMLPIQVVES
jgi:hypothetical protein